MFIPNQTNALHGDIQKIYDFSNGYSASVVKHFFSYGNEDDLWELAVLQGGKICYTTPITDAVLGHLTDDQVEEILLQISNLPKEQS